MVVTILCCNLFLKISFQLAVMKKIILTDFSFKHLYINDNNNNTHFPIEPNGPVDWGSGLHQLHQCKGMRPPPNKCPGYDTKQSDGEAPVMLERQGMRSTLSLPLLPDPL